MRHLESTRLPFEHRVTREERVAMDADSDRCALEPADARVDVLGYTCLVATLGRVRGDSRLQRLGWPMAVPGFGALRSGRC